jgi:Fe/S biogenesis protein NfuA
MLNITEAATTRVRDFLAQQAGQGVRALRIAGTRNEHRLWLVKESDQQEGDRIQNCDGFDIYLDPMTVRHLDGATLDFVDGVMQSGFRVFFPSPAWDDPLAQRVQEVLDAEVNPGVASHGGSVSLVKVDGDVAVIELHGGCQGCGAADITLKQGIERMIKGAVPAIRAVQDATDHAAGKNPYYAPDAARTESPIA